MTTPTTPPASAQVPVQVPVQVDEHHNRTIRLTGALACHPSLQATISVTAGPHFPMRARFVATVEVQRLAVLFLDHRAALALRALDQLPGPRHGATQPAAGPLIPTAATLAPRLGLTGPHRDGHEDTGTPAPTDVQLDATDDQGRPATITIHACAPGDTNVAVTVTAPVLGGSSTAVPMVLHFPVTERLRDVAAAITHVVVPAMSAVEISGTCYRDPRPAEVLTSADDDHSSVPTTLHVIGRPALLHTWLVAIKHDNQPPVRVHVDRAAAEQFKQALHSAAAYHTSNRPLEPPVQVPAIDEYGHEACLTVDTPTQHGANVAITATRISSDGSCVRTATLELPHLAVSMQLISDLDALPQPEHAPAD